MGKPKILSMFDNNTSNVAYSRLNNPIIGVTSSGQTIVVPENISICGITTLTFVAPCNCSEIFDISVGGILYPIVDTCNNSISTGNAFVHGAIVSVVIDPDSRYAYLHGAVSSRNDEGESTSDYAETAGRLHTPREISLTGEVSGKCEFDGSSGVEINVTIEKEIGTATEDSDGLMTTSHVAKLSGIEEGATRNIINAGTEDLVPGESPLSPGAIYLVYEEVTE